MSRIDELMAKRKSTEDLNNKSVIDSVKHAEELDKVKEAEHSDKSDEASKAEEAKTSDKAEEAVIADEVRKLTDEQTEQIINALADKLANGDRADILKQIAQKVNEISLEAQWEYTPSESSGEFNTQDLYEDSVISDARNILDKSHRLLILGSTGTGKTELAYLLAHEFTGEDVASGDTKLQRVCVVDARDGKSLWVDDVNTERYVGELNRFNKYIKKKNKEAGSDSETCKYVLICNEIQASDAGYLLGSLWESANNSEEKFNKLEDNLYIIFTACTDQDFGIDDQIKERINNVDVGYISSKYKDKHRKIVEAYIDKNKNIEEILNNIEYINDKEEYSIITMRKFITEILANGKVQCSDYIKKTYSKEIGKIEELSKQGR